PRPAQRKNQRPQRLLPEPSPATEVTLPGRHRHNPGTVLRVSASNTQPPPFTNPARQRKASAPISHCVLRVQHPAPKLSRTPPVSAQCLWPPSLIAFSASLRLRVQHPAPNFHEPHPSARNVSAPSASQPDKTPSPKSLIAFSASCSASSRLRV